MSEAIGGKFFFSLDLTRNPLVIFNFKVLVCFESRNSDSEFGIEVRVKEIEHYFENMRRVRLEYNIPANPALLILDPHSSRGDLDALEFAKASGLHIVLLPGGMTHILQPLDKSSSRSSSNNTRMLFMRSNQMNQRRINWK